MMTSSMYSFLKISCKISKLTSYLIVFFSLTQKDSLKNRAYLTIKQKLLPFLSLRQCKKIDLIQRIPANLCVNTRSQMKSTPGKYKLTPAVVIYLFFTDHIVLHKIINICTVLYSMFLSLQSFVFHVDIRKR
jgi:hypothetical protein